ncbi:MAG: hypothetical protein WCV99_03035 [Sterolibacterium sp.]
MLTERAALAGELECLQQSIPRLTAYQAKLTKYLERCTKELERGTQRQPQVARLIDGLDSTIRMLDERVEPTSGGVVHTKVGRHGRLGDQQTFVIFALKAASPAYVSITTLKNMVIEAFELTPSTPKARRKVGQYMATICRKLGTEGKAEQLKSSKINGVSSWRWKSPLPSLTALAKKDQAARQAVEDPEASP